MAAAEDTKAASGAGAATRAEEDEVEAEEVDEEVEDAEADDSLEDEDDLAIEVATSADDEDESCVSSVASPAPLAPDSEAAAALDESGSGGAKLRGPAGYMCRCESQE
jgi:hypothetical protein